MYAYREDLYKRKAFEMRYFSYNVMDKPSAMGTLSDVKKEISPRKIAKTSLSAANKPTLSALPLNTLKTNSKIIKKTKLDNYISFCSAENIYKINLEKNTKNKPMIFKKGMSSIVPKATTKPKERKIKSVLIEPLNLLNI